MATTHTTPRLSTLAAELGEGWELEHTGGGCMALVLDRPEGSTVVTDEDSEVLVGFYAGTTWTDGPEDHTRMTVLSGALSTPALVDAIRALTPTA